MERERDPILLQFFWPLAENDLIVRNEAVKNLIGHLIEKQQSTTPPSLCPQIGYTLQRLIKGMCSPRDGARKGFTTALIEVQIFL
jgi:hypothetical protein